MILEIIRFLSHITLLHILNYMIDNKDELFDISYLKVMLFTTMAIVIYHIIIKKLFKDKTKKMKLVCASRDKE
jgi:hypothetical protein